MATKPIARTTTKLGTARGVERSRIWIEGARLAEAGFNSGSYYVKDWAPELLTLTLLTDDDIITQMPCKVSGDAARPIIDIVCSDVREAFKGCDRVSVEFFKGKIVITGTK